jgi:hypothetical protein
MPLYEVGDEDLRLVPRGAFANLGLSERYDLQRLLLRDISVLGDDLYVVGEEVTYWKDARRRIDILAVDRTGRLVIIEIKRTDDGGHMDLQSIRYAAMVSSFTFDEVVRIHADHLSAMGAEAEEAEANLTAFLSLDEEEPTIATDVRIILVSADFGREITTTVLWLNGFEGMDVRCVRLMPYEIDGKVLIDVQQAIPLPEAADYQVRVRRKEAARERARSDGRDWTQYHVIVDGQALPAERKRHAVRVMIQELHQRGVPLRALAAVLPASRVKAVPGMLQDEADVRTNLEQLLGSAARVERFFTEHPLIDPEEGITYVLSKMWGRNTEPTLTALVEAFPDSGVRFAPASD